MDDIYFSDKKKRTDRNNDITSRRISSDSFSDTDRIDGRFIVDFGDEGSAYPFSPKENFSVTLPEDEDYIAPPTDRTPKGRPVSYLGANYTAPEYNSYNADPGSEGNDLYSGRGTGVNRGSVNMASDYSRPTNKTPYERKSISPRTPQQDRPSSPQASHSPSGTTQERAPLGRRVNNPGGSQGARPSGSAYPGGRPPQRPVQRPPQRPAQRPAHRPTASKKKAITLAVLSVVAILMISVFALGLSMMSGLNYDDSITENAYVDEDTLMSSNDVVNILFIGSDARSNVEGQRSDTMLMFSIDKQNKKLKLTSFLRDSYVYIPSKQFNTKLNAAFSYGGTQLVMDTLEYNFGVDIDHYLMVDFKAFRQLVDLLGGITVEDVSAAEAKYMREDVNLTHVVEGTNEMNGKTALWYCRIRYVDNDFKRTERQRKVITAIVSKALKTNPIKLVNIVKEVLPNISTDISQSELLGLAMGAALQYIHYDIEQHQVPAKGTWSDARINGQAVLKMDIYENADLLKSFLYDKDTKEDKIESE